MSQKLEKATEDILQINAQNRKTEPSHSILMAKSQQNFRDSANFSGYWPKPNKSKQLNFHQKSISQPSLNIKSPFHWQQSQLNKQSFYDGFPMENDSFINSYRANYNYGLSDAQKQNKIKIYESKFQRLVDNYQTLEDMRKKEKDQLQNKLEKSPKLQALQTRPDTLQEIQQKHQDCFEIMDQQDHMKDRVKQVFQTLHSQTYQKAWKQSYFPISFQERKTKGKKVKYQKNLTPFRFNNNYSNNDENTRTGKQWKF